MPEAAVKQLFRLVNVTGKSAEDAAVPINFFPPTMAIGTEVVAGEDDEEPRKPAEIFISATHRTQSFIEITGGATVTLGRGNLAGREVIIHPLSKNSLHGHTATPELKKQWWLRTTR